jgi:hypothetical protein
MRGFLALSPMAKVAARLTPRNLHIRHQVHGLDVDSIELLQVLDH